MHALDPRFKLKFLISLFLVFVATSLAYAQVADFNADGKPDLLWRNTATGQNAIWYMNGANGATFSSGVYLNSLSDQNWQIAGGTAARCPNISGTWNFTESISLTIRTTTGPTVTQPISGSGSGTITQNGSNVVWTDATDNTSFSGTISGNTLHFSEPLIGSAPGFVTQQDILSWSGTVSADRGTITMNGTGNAWGSYQGVFFICDANATITLTRTP